MEQAATPRTARRLVQGNHLHRLMLGRAGDGTGRERRLQQVHRSGSSPCQAGHRRNQMMDSRMALDLEQCRNGDRAGLRDQRQIIAHQVDDHQILGLVLDAGAEFGGEHGVLGRIGMARPCPLDRPAIDAPARWIEGQKQLGRVRYDGPVAQTPEGTIGRRPPGQPQHDVEGIATGAQRAGPAPGDIGLVELAGRNPLHDIADGGAIGRRRRFLDEIIGGSRGDDRVNGVGQPALGPVGRRTGGLRIISPPEHTHGPDLVVECQHGGIAGQHKVRPDRITRAGRGPGSGIIGQQADHPGLEVRAPQPVQSPTRP